MRTKLIICFNFINVWSFMYKRKTFQEQKMFGTCKYSRKSLCLSVIRMNLPSFIGIELSLKKLSSMPKLTRLATSLPLVAEWTNQRNYFNSWEGHRPTASQEVLCNFEIDQQRRQHKLFVFPKNIYKAHFSSALKALLLQHNLRYSYASVSSLVFSFLPLISFLF